MFREIKFLFCTLIGVASNSGALHSIAFHKDCTQPVLTTCPKTVNHLQPTTLDSKRNMIPKLTVTQLDGDMVGTLSWQTHDSTKSNVLINHSILRLSLLVKGNSTDVKCLNISTPALKEEYCMKITPDNSAELIMDVVVSPDQSCDCDIINMSSASLRRCKRGCIETETVISRETHALGELSCKIIKHAEPEYVKMKLSVWEITPDHAKFELLATVSNPYARADIFIHPDDAFQPLPILHMQAIPDEKGQIYVNEPSSLAGETTFYAKLCLRCAADDPLHECYVTDYIHSKQLPILSECYRVWMLMVFLVTQCLIWIGTVCKDDPMATPNNELKEDDDRQSKWTQLVPGILTGAALTVSLVTLIVWCTLKKKRRPSHKQMVTNNMTSETVPLSLRNDSNSSYPLEAICQQSEPSLTDSELHEETSMILYHPDNQSHVDIVTNLVNCLKDHDINITGMPGSQCFENWRDFAEQAGQKYTDIVIAYSQGLHQLFRVYTREGRIGGDNMELWESLMQQRNQEYIPCVALTSLKYMYQHRITTFCLHFVIFQECDRSPLCDLISKQFSFLHGNNFRIYVILNTDHVESQDNSTSHLNSPALHSLIQYLKTSNKKYDENSLITT